MLSAVSSRSPVVMPVLTASARERKTQEQRWRFFMSPAKDRVLQSFFDIERRDNFNFKTFITSADMA